MPILRILTCAPVAERAINLVAEAFSDSKKDRNISEAKHYRRFYEKAAEEDQSKKASGLDVWYNANRKQIVMELVGSLEGHIVLDAGCAEGSFSSICVEKEGGLPVGVDISIQRLRKAKALNSRFDFVCCDIEKLPFRSESFDNALLLEVIEHVLNPKIMIVELSRVLKNSSGLLISTPNAINPFDLEFVKHAFIPASTSGHLRKYSIWSLKEILNQQGLNASIFQIKGNLPFIFPLLYFDYKSRNQISNSLMLRVIEGIGRIYYKLPLSFLLCSQFFILAKKRNFAHPD